MWLWRIIKAIGKYVYKSRVKAPIKRLIKTIKNPKKALKGAVRTDFRYKRKIEKFRSLRRLTPKGRKIQQIKRKARIVENMTRDINEFISNRSNARRERPETLKQLSDINNHLFKLSHEELNDIDQVLNNELEDLGLKNDEQLERAILEEEYRSDLIEQRAYEIHMNNWKDGLLNLESEVVSDGVALSEEERLILWEEIKNDYTQSKFKEKNEKED